MWFGGSGAPRERGRISRVDLAYLSVAAWELLVARARHLVVPVKSIVGELQDGEPTKTEPGKMPAPGIDIERVAWAIGQASCRVPWRADCLIQAMAAARWMRRHHLRPEFYLGVAHGENGEFRAHAWLRHGAMVVTGGDAKEFSPLISPSNSSAG